MGRPTKLTPEVQTAICNAISAGNYYEAAAAYAGIDYATFSDWMRRGEGRSKNRKTNAAYVAFVAAVHKAQADAEVTIVAQWKQQIPTNWAAARDFLGRRFPKRWANVEKIQVNPDDVEAAIITELARVAGRSKAEDAGAAAPDADGGGNQQGT